MAGVIKPTRKRTVQIWQCPVCQGTYESDIEITQVVHRCDPSVTTKKVDLQLVWSRK